ncbi:hypothetical protein C7T87_01285 [Xanthomonas hortorum pv. hederae]|nr:hypothetical protein C7T87_01285 [Xanthomonas hortorum pv. hederae]
MRVIGARALERPRRKRGPGRGAGVGVRVRSEALCQLSCPPTALPVPATRFLVHEAAPVPSSGASRHLLPQGEGL